MMFPFETSLSSLKLKIQMDKLKNLINNVKKLKFLIYS